MRQRHVTATLVVSCCASLASIGNAQDSRNDDARAREQRSQQTCVPGGGSRTRPACEPEQTTLRTEQELKFSLEAPQLPSAQCEANVAIDYGQRNTVARVESKIAIASCAAASGDYKLTVRIKNEQGVTETLSFTQTWQRTEPADIVSSTDYQIGENVELVGVRVSGVRCTCADAPPTERAPAPE